jgi:hypothetical protein
MSEDGQSKQFVVSVRVLNDAVEQIPPITYSWFDPQTAAYQTTQSSPIALQVLPAQMIGAEDVIGSTEEPESDTGAEDVTEPVEPTPVDDLTGADLTIETDLGRLMTGATQGVGGGWMQGALYGGSLVLVLVAAWRRKSADVDPAVIERRRLVKQQLARIREAGSLPRQDGARDIADACRRLVPYVEDGRRPEVDAIIRECDAWAFAPAGGRDERIETELHHRAVELARQVSEESR